ncbi:MAG: hypothetical protein WCK88_05690 [bacterium]
MKNILSFFIIFFTSFFLISCQQNTAVISNNTLPAEETKTTIIEKNIGDILTLATINFSIKKFEESNVLNSKYDAPVIARESTKFVILDVEVVNTTKNPFPHNDA